MVKNWNREVLGVEVVFSLPAALIVALLTILVGRHGEPARIRVDNSTELIRQELLTWCQGQIIDLHWIQPASPTQNTCIERFDGPYRREFLDAHIFGSLRHMRELYQSWQYDYNYLRRAKPLTF